MPFATNTTGEHGPVKIYYEDKGKGKTFILIHGWPLQGGQWDYQVPALLDAGYRVITYDRRGFGKSDRPGYGYDYVAMAGDLKAVIDEANVSDAIVVGFSMGGGEIAKYASHYNNANVSKYVIVSSVLPYLQKADDNPNGVPAEVFEEMAEGIKKDRPAFLHNFSKDFYGVGFLSNPVSDAFLQENVTMAMDSSIYATLECAKAFAQTDFRADVPSITLPTLIIHGTKDETVPIEASADRLAEMLPAAEYKKYEGEPHGLFYTAREKFTKDLIDFAGK